VKSLKTLLVKGKGEGYSLEKKRYGLKKGGGKGKIIQGGPLSLSEVKSGEGRGDLALGEKRRRKEVRSRGKRKGRKCFKGY